MDLTSSFASRTARVSSWTQFTEDPKMISLAGGLPDTSLMGAETHAQLLSEVVDEDSARALQYSPTRGLAAARKAATTVMAVEGLHVDPEDLIITTGGQQAIDLLCRTFLDPGDVVIAEAPTYPGALLPFASHGARVVQVEMDDEGMRIDALSAAIECVGSRQRVKLIYSVPTFQNPTGRTLSLTRRRQLLAVAQRYDLPVIEDNPYGLLRFDGDRLPTLKELDPDGRVLYVGTFSKLLGPGLRVGWLAAPASVLDHIDLGKQCADLCTPATSQLFVAAYVQRHDWQGYVRRQVGVYRDRRDAMLGALALHLPEGSTWTRPEGGLFVWATLPTGFDIEQLHRAATRNSVSFVPGIHGYATPCASNTELRLNFSAVDVDLIREGIRRLGETIAQQQPVGASASAK